jgi:hypothetical protein
MAKKQEKVRCAANNKAGERCKRVASAGSKYCSSHKRK